MRSTVIVRAFVAAAISCAPLAVQAQPRGCAANAIAPAVAPSAQAAQVAVGPSVWAIVDGSCFDLSSYLTDVEKGKIWAMDAKNLDLGFGLFSMSALINADPFITFGVTTTNIAAGPVSYSFLFSTPVVPGLYASSTSTGGVSVTNGARGSVSVTTSGFYPTYISGYGLVGASPTNLGVDLGTAACTATGAPFTVTTTCAHGSTLNTYAPTFFDGMQALITYTQSDIGSVASWSGAVTLNSQVVPEPATLLLVGVGVFTMGAVAVRRRRG